MPPQTDQRISSQLESAPPDLMPDFVRIGTAGVSLLCDMNGIVAAWSKGAEELFGWNSEEAIGKSIADLIVPMEHWPDLDRSLKKFCKTGHHQLLGRQMETVVLHKDRHLVPIEYTASLLRIAEQRYFNVSIQARSANKKDEKELLQHASMLKLSRDAIMVINIDGEILLWNDGAQNLFQYTEHEALGRKSHELLSAQYPIDRADIEQQLVLTGHWEGEIGYTTRDGTRLSVLSRWALERDDDKGGARILISNTDIGQWKRSLEASAFIRAEGQSFDSLFGLHPDGVFAFNQEGRLIAANPAISKLTGYSEQELMTISLAQLVDQADLAKLRFNFSEAQHGTPATQEFTCIRKDKTQFDASITMLPNMVNHKINGMHGIIKDISHRKLDERRILYLATHDPLTGLANRNLLNDRMQHAFEQARHLNFQVGVLFMDLNRFKVINDSLGHDKGDILLCTIADRLKGAVREIDTVARLGGDEFVVLLENISAPDEVATVAKNLMGLVMQPVKIGGDTLTVSTSIGGSIYPQDGNDPATLLKNADLAMYSAKRSGAAMFHLYTPEMNARAVAQLALENSLRRAIDRSELTLHYQPRLDIVKNQLVGVEALVRWNHPGKGMILPANFIPLAEEIGVIDALGEWVLRTACRQLRHWQDAGMQAIKMAINVSALQLRSESLFGIIEAVLGETGLDPESLELEITESSLMQDLDDSYRKLMKIRSLGIAISIDDFGTGYSSLSYLKRLPIDTLKIDKTFVRDVPENVDDSAIVSSTIAMAHNMNLRVVAEGVTSFDQLRFLKSCHCDEIQGYLLCQPLPPLDTETFFRTSQLHGIQYSWAH